MSYTAQDLFDYSVENAWTMDVHEIMEAMDLYPNNISDAFEYHVLKNTVGHDDAQYIISLDHAGDL